jgi:outer membrane protein assembly factor BamB
MSSRALLALSAVVLILADAPLGAAEPDAGAGNWPQFRGPAASGVVQGAEAPVQWDVEQGTNVRWKTPIPGLGHSAPAIWGDRLFITTAVAAGHDQSLKPGLYGDIAPVKEDVEFSYKVLCLDKHSGRVLWEQTAHRGVPEVQRHPKSTHANPTPAVDGKRVVAFFGSEGLHCYDLDGTPVWQKNFGRLGSAFFLVPDAEWGFASSPVLYDDKVIVQVDVLEDSFVAALDATNGRELWRTPRTDVPTWSTPTVHRDETTGRTQVICNGFKEMAGYDLASGKKLWTLGGAGDIPVPTPVVAHGLVFLTSAHGMLSPVYAIRLSAEGDLTPGRGDGAKEHIAWSVPRGGNYMQTPIVVGDHLYACRDNGVLTCFEARTGKELYRERLEGLGFTASPVASVDKLYFTSEDGLVQVVQAGPTFKLLSTNPLGANCLSTPAISNGVLFFRTQQYLVAIGEETPKQ